MGGNWGQGAKYGTMWHNDSNKNVDSVV